MQLILTWPAPHKVIEFDEQYSIVNAISFNSEKEAFISAGNEGDDVLFYRTESSAVILNRSHDFTCAIDGEPLVCGESRYISVGSEIQFSHCNITLRYKEGNVDIKESLQLALANQNNDDIDDLAIGKHDVMNDMGLHIPYFHDGNAPDKGSECDDNEIIKSLGSEYKSFLTWGEVNKNNYFEQNNASGKLVGGQDYFYLDREAVKNKTLTDCILDSTTLIDKFLEELMQGEDVPLDIFERDKNDILRELAPENIVSKSKGDLPTIILQDIHKLDINSIL
ncbi:TagK domain-containing protein [Erwinia amylovora]